MGIMAIVCAVHIVMAMAMAMEKIEFFVLSIAVAAVV